MTLKGVKLVSDANKKRMAQYCLPPQLIKDIKILSQEAGIPTSRWVTQHLQQLVEIEKKKLFN